MYGILGFYLFMIAFSTCVIYLIIREYFNISTWNWNTFFASLTLGVFWPVSLLPIVLFYLIYRS